MEKQNTISKGNGALDAFLNLLVLISLGWLVTSIGKILFNVVDNYFAPNNYYYGYNVSVQVGLKAGIASLIILLPIFLIVVTVLHAQYQKQKLNNTSGIHRWLTYLMLLASALTVIGSLVALIVNFLNGEYTANVLLKILIILLLALGIFGYFGYDLKRKEYSKKSTVSIVAFIIILVVGIGSLVGSFLIIDSPKVSKMKRMDLIKVEHLNTINANVLSFYFTNKKLPTIEEAKIKSLFDPETKQPYEYNVLGENEYELCANFSYAVPENEKMHAAEEWYSHLAGRQCFAKSISETNLNNMPIGIKQ